MARIHCLPLLRYPGRRSVAAEYDELCRRACRHHGYRSAAAVAVRNVVTRAVRSRESISTAQFNRTLVVIRSRISTRHRPAASTGQVLADVFRFVDVVHNSAFRSARPGQGDLRKASCRHVDPVDVDGSFSTELHARGPRARRQARRCRVPRQNSRSSHSGRYGWHSTCTTAGLMRAASWIFRFAAQSDVRTGRYACICLRRRALHRPPYPAVSRRRRRPSGHQARQNFIRRRSWNAKGVWIR